MFKLLKFIFIKDYLPYHSEIFLCCLRKEILKTKVQKSICHFSLNKVILFFYLLVNKNNISKKNISSILVLKKKVCINTCIEKFGILTPLVCTCVVNNDSNDIIKFKGLKLKRNILHVLKK